ncbi:hypothetical protein AB0H73_39225 [Streptomyces olivoreticuli]
MKRSHGSGRNPVSPSEARQLAVASATLGPWRAAGAVAAIGSAVSLGLHTVTGDFGLAVVAGALSVGLMLFFLVGGIGGVLGDRSANSSEHRIRRWARAHPWQVAVVPAGALLVSDLVMRQVLTDESFFSSMWDGLWRGALVAVVTGLIGTFGASRR